MTASTLRDYAVSVLLRDSPFIYYRGVHTWPPTWMWAGKGDESTTARGEVGVLNQVHASIVDASQPKAVRPYNRIYLFIDYRDGEFLGCLLFDNAAACRQIGEILSHHCGKTIQEIGDLDLSQLL